MSKDAIGDHVVTGLDRRALRRSYQDRGVEHWSDAELVWAVAAVVADPRQDEAASFVLHAPLELAARAALLPFVRPESRELARLHIMNIAAEYEASGPPAVFARLPRNQKSTAATLLRVIADGDLDEVDNAVRGLSHITTTQLLDDMVDAVAPLTGAAAHTPILLQFLRRTSPRGELPVRLLRPLARELARAPGWRLRWFDDEPGPGGGTTTDLVDVLSSQELLGVPGSTFIHPILDQLEQHHGSIDRLRRNCPEYSPESAAAVLRVAARSMLEDTPEHARYGWTHCLTLPQAVLDLVGFSRDPSRMLAIAASQVAGFRAALGDRLLDPSPPPLSAMTDAEFRGRTADLATAASVSHDAHVVKYTLACLDAAAADREQAALFVAAAQRLLDVWASGAPGPDDPLGSES